MPRGRASFRLVNATLVLPDRLVPDGALHVEHGRLTAVGERRALPAWPGATIDAEGHFVAPGFIDLHVHGGDNADFMDGTIEAFETAIRAHTRHGVTTIVPTSTVAYHEQTLAFLHHAHAMRQRGAEPDRGLGRTLGAHLYGPFFADDKVGCHPKLPARPPVPAEYEAYLDLDGVVVTATCAPELPGAADFYRAAAARGVRLNAGHSNATWTEMAMAHALGVRHVDHFYCAMSSVASLRDRCGTPMQASMLEFVLDHEDMTTEVIADGRHLSPELLRFVVKWKGAGRTALVTDCSRALDCPPGLYMFGPADGGETFYNDGTVGLLPDSPSLASSVRGMDFMVRHLHQAAGVDLPAAVRMATLTPAVILGRDAGLGSLAAGKLADLVVLDAALEVRRVFVAGEPVASA
jgi:N-acetylglucosamine-6-phosphate deacetylase